MNSGSFMTGREASRILGVHQRTLYLWDTKGTIQTIRTPGNKRMYNVDKFIKDREALNKDKPVVVGNKNIIIETDITTKMNICYVRVSSVGQKDDLSRQKQMMVDLYPNHIIIEDIGSGVNFNRRGIRKLIKLAIAGQINEVVVAYKDRLTRFGYELIEDLIDEYSNGKIIILNKNEDLEPEEELAIDMLQIMNVFVAKMNGSRKYKNKHDEKNE